MENNTKRTRKAPKEPDTGAPRKKAKPRVPRKRIYISSSDDEEYEVLTAKVQVKESAPPDKRASPPTVGGSPPEEATRSATFQSLKTVTGTPPQMDRSRSQLPDAARAIESSTKLPRENADILDTEAVHLSPQVVKAGLRTPQEAAAYYDHNFRDNVEDDFFRPMQANPLAGEMDVGMLDGFIRYVLAMHERSVLYVSLNYSVYVDAQGLDNVINSGLEDYIVAGDRSTFDLAVISIRLAHGHYVLSIYEVHTGLVRYYDPLPRPMDIGHHLDSILRMAAYLHDTYHPDTPPVHFVVQDPTIYNHQSDDISCGFFVSLYVEMYLHRGATGTLRVVDTFLADYRRRVVRIMSDLYNGNFPDYGELPGADRRRPQRAAAAKAAVRSADLARECDDSQSEKRDSESDASIEVGSPSSSDGENERPSTTESTTSVGNQPTPASAPTSNIAPNDGVDLPEEEIELDDYYYGDQVLTPELLRNRKPVDYHHYRYFCRQGNTPKHMTWYCSQRSGTRCTSTFTCDARGENFVQTRTVHNHDQRRKKQSSSKLCNVCRYIFKSDEDRTAHFHLSGHDTFLYECDYPGCKHKRQSVTVMNTHMEKHYGANEGQKEHVSEYHGPGSPNLVLGLDDGDKCPECSQRIVCLSHYAWHMEEVHNVHSRDITNAKHLRCLACSACILFSQARNHFQIFCPFFIIPALRAAMTSSDVDRKLMICDCKCSPFSPHDYPEPLKIWSANMVNVIRPLSERKLSSLAQKFFSRQKTAGNSNAVYVVVQVDPQKSYTVAEFAGRVRYVGSCENLKTRYVTSNSKFVPALPPDSTDRLYAVRTCALVNGKTVQLFCDGDSIVLETFMVFHFGPQNLYNIRYPLGAHTAAMDLAFNEFVPASGEIVQAILEGTYNKIVIPRNWNEPDAMPYEVYNRGTNTSTKHGGVASVSSTSKWPKVVQRPSTTIYVATSNSPVYTPVSSTHTPTITRVRGTSADATSEPVNSQECADVFHAMLESLRASEGISTEEAFARVLRKPNLQPLAFGVTSPQHLQRQEIRACHKTFDTPNDGLSPANMDSGINFDFERSVLFVSSPISSTATSNPWP